MKDADDDQNVGAVVLAYHPDASLVGNVLALVPQVSAIVVVNNSPGAEPEVFEQLRGIAAVEVIDLPGNLGVAAGFNAGMRRVFETGHRYAVIFDQDSTAPPGLVQGLVDAYRSFGAGAGIVGPALRSGVTGHEFRRERGSGIGVRATLISSGALFSREVVERIGLHDEGLFIDYVDHDISLRARRRGLKNLKAFDVVLDHRFGGAVPRRLFGRDFFVADYSPMRQYYMSRNRLVLIRRYGFGAWFWEDLSYMGKAWAKVLLFEGDRPRKVGAFFRGARDGLRYDAKRRDQASGTTS
ncbi:glycosyltransferase family 2 protein [Microbacterium ureisolvens]|uniref:Glycosyltransferase family 2 protein n=1 Tax=Microbacterium ureisolvens TaxID=2781186 RepID=A0ABS7I822_9MICO|nr:glycosyltransferase family 2 protein [Microbacterium ureisolvens]MBW9111868.1 glycosyltransferase family 2 protein [Microbacterium ureisolvens]